MKEVQELSSLGRKIRMNKDGQQINQASIFSQIHSFGDKGSSQEAPYVIAGMKRVDTTSPQIQSLAKSLVAAGRLFPVPNKTSYVLLQVAAKPGFEMEGDHLEDVNFDSVSKQNVLDEQAADEALEGGDKKLSSVI